MHPPLQAALSLSLLAGCGPLFDHRPNENFLIIIADDVGTDKTSAYGDENAPPTPNIDALAAEGLLFRNAYSCPSCSPTRAALLTGRLPTRTGVGRWIYPNHPSADLPNAELTLPEMLGQARRRYTSAIMGKWHLVTFARDTPATHPQDQGFDQARGALSNLDNSVSGSDRTMGAYNWEKNTDGALSWSLTYAGTDTTDEALGFLAETREPWLLVVSYNLAHLPVEVPPEGLNPTGVTDASSDLARYHANVMALDAEIGRLLRGLDDDVRANTTIVYLSDNGTDSQWIQWPNDSRRAKHTVYDGGVRVPFIVASPHVRTPGAETDALVHVVDIFPTIAELAGVNAASLTVEEGEDRGAPIALDGLSFTPILDDPAAPGPRTYVYTEGFYPNGPNAPDYHLRMVRDAEWKLIHDERAGELRDEHLFRYQAERTDEGADLLRSSLSAEENAAAARLNVEMNNIIGSLQYGF